MPHPHAKGAHRRRDPAPRSERAFRPLGAEEVKFVAAMKRSHVALTAGEFVIKANARVSAFYTVYEGWASRYRMLPNGARQILDFVLPGDLVGLPSVFFGSSRYSVRALTPITLCELDATLLPTLLREEPRLTWAFLKARIAEQERADTRLTLLGRLGASERIGYLLLELRDRLRARGLFRGRSSALPLDRALLADAVGLSRVHVLRAMRALRSRGLADLTDRVLTIPSVRNLARFCGYPLAQAVGAQAIL
jgi:CRP/FNR family transcriptional regulator, anaerobic regulatory protein